MPAKRKTVVKSVAKKKAAPKKNFIKTGIKRKGKLTKLVGGKPSENISKVEKLAKSGTTLQKQEANFFLNVINPINKKRKKK